MAALLIIYGICAYVLHYNLRHTPNFPFLYATALFVTEIICLGVNLYLFLKPVCVELTSEEVTNLFLKIEPSTHLTNATGKATYKFFSFFLLTFNNQTTPEQIYIHDQDSGKKYLIIKDELLDPENALCLLYTE